MAARNKPEAVRVAKEVKGAAKKAKIKQGSFSDAMTRAASGVNNNGKNN
jgi:hypothetical protein